MAASAAFLFAVAALSAMGSSLDDPYIFSRYARNLLAHGDILWNAGEPRIEGFTSWAWLGVHAIGLRLGWHPVGFARLVGILLGSVYAAVFVAALRRRVGVWPTVAFGLMGALAPDLWFYAASGMDTMLWTLSAWIWLVWFARRPELSVGHVVSAGALLLVRPEAMLLLALCVARAALQVWTRRTSVREAVWPLLVGGLMPAAFFAARYALFGQLLANSVEAKHLGGNIVPRMLSGLAYAAGEGQVYLLPAAVVAAMVVAAGSRVASLTDVLASAPSRLFAAMCAFSVLTVAMIVAVGGDDVSAFPLARLLVPILGPVAYCLAAALDAMAISAARRRAASVLLAVLFVVLFLPRARVVIKLSAAATNMTSVGGMIDSIRARAFPPPSGASVFFLRATPPDAVIAIPWAGRIPYETGLRVIDLNGLNDRHIASMAPPQRGTDVKYDTAYIFGRRPYFICEAVSMRAPTSQIVRMSSQELYAAGAWKVGQRALLHDPRLAAEYELDSGASASTGGTCFRRKTAE